MQQALDRPLTGDLRTRSGWRGRRVLRIGIAVADLVRTDHRIRLELGHDLRRRILRQAPFVHALAQQPGFHLDQLGALVGFVAVAGTLLIATKMQMLPLPLFMALSALMMFAFGLMFANFTALAMEPQGHIAGTASSLYGSITTLLGIGIGTVIGQDYDGTLVPFATGFFLCTLASLAVVLVTEKGRLFKARQMPAASGA